MTKSFNQIRKFYPKNRAKTGVIVFLQLICFLIIGASTANAQVLARSAVLSSRLNVDTIISSNSFNSTSTFNTYWRYLYPWGPDHNGSARMYKENVSISGGILKLTANRITTDEGSSKSTPFLKIDYHSGTISNRQPIAVTDSFPEYQISGYFKVPIETGVWPAFWLTAVKSWPPEIDILEYMGSNMLRQNTFTPPHTRTSKYSNVASAENTWHQYKVVLKKLNNTDISVEYYFDGKLTQIHKGVNYFNKPMWLIINLQMEGMSGGPGPQTVSYYAKNVQVIRYRSY
ncbi:family 16 glycosylhydrolase [Mucilaginibacter sp. X5P1]|uniref:family 16 glycosylhydrolase n=1 Tax=Mucilaginibacter sp. X5P1 TaxID=2723088 RepID=UPI0016136652|nr:family 16 glycosylhydrolase [Mucilaginibacter sp. X5P1]MBB6141201.1 beta-glucanase (GH16 family) [Mucilaginibacter sp. X5P1]